MSPRIDLTVEGVAYDEKNLILYVNISQVFRIWAIPFYNAPVSLVTVLKLARQPPLPPHPSYSTPINPNDRNGSLSKSEKPLYYIQSQNDLYQVNQFFKFFSQFGILSGLLFLLQFVSTAICILGATVFWPVSWVEQNVIGGNREKSIAEAARG